jgi:hypothetical protein
VALDFGIEDKAAKSVPAIAFELPSDRRRLNWPEIPPTQEIPPEADWGGSATKSPDKPCWERLLSLVSFANALEKIASPSNPNLIVDSTVPAVVAAQTSSSVPKQNLLSPPTTPRAGAKPGTFALRSLSPLLDAKLAKVAAKIGAIASSAGLPSC